MTEGGTVSFPDEGAQIVLKRAIAPHLKFWEALCKSHRKEAAHDTWHPQPICLAMYQLHDKSAVYEEPTGKAVAIRLNGLGIECHRHNDQEFL